MDSFNSLKSFYPTVPQLKGSDFSKTLPIYQKYHFSCHAGQFAIRKAGSGYDVCACGFVPKFSNPSKARFDDWFTVSNYTTLSSAVSVFYSCIKECIGFETQVISLDMCINYLQILRNRGVENGL